MLYKTIPDTALSSSDTLLSDDLLVTEKLETTKCEFPHLIAHKYTKLATVLHIILHFFPSGMESVFLLARCDP